MAFRSHIDGRLLDLTPERAVAIQEDLGADVAMCLDHCPALPASKEADRRRRRPDDPLGRALQGGPHRARPGAVRDRPGGRPRRPPRPSAPRRWSRSTSPATPSAGVSVGESREEVREALRGHDAPPAGGPAALPDGGRPAAGPARRGRRRDRPVRLRHADPQRPQRHCLTRPGAGQAPQRRAPARPPADRGGLRLPGLPRSSAGPTCATCSWPRRCSGRSWPRCTTWPTCTG